jgi:hypothetical protein
MSGRERQQAPTETTPRPTLGRVVLVPEKADHNNGFTVACAVVVGVAADTVNVRVWADNSDTPEWRTSLHEVASPEEFEPGKLNAWCWPPR